MITVIVIFTGLMMCGGLVLRHQLRIAPLVQNDDRPKRNHRSTAVTGLPQMRHVFPALNCRAKDPKTRHLMKRLRREEKRQRPQEARN